MSNFFRLINYVSTYIQYTIFTTTDFQPVRTLRRVSAAAAFSPGAPSSNTLAVPRERSLRTPRPQPERNLWSSAPQASDARLPACLRLHLHHFSRISGTAVCPDPVSQTRAARELRRATVRVYWHWMAITVWTMEWTLLYWRLCRKTRKLAHLN